VIQRVDGKVPGADELMNNIGRRRLGRVVQRVRVALAQESDVCVFERIFQPTRQERIPIPARPRKNPRQVFQRLIGTKCKEAQLCSTRKKNMVNKSAEREAEMGGELFKGTLLQRGLLSVLRVQCRRTCQLVGLCA